jgi:hypothetical protein
MFEKKILLSEHKEIVSNILKAHESQLELIFDLMDKEITSREQTIKGLKYVSINPLRLSLKSSRAKILMQFRKLTNAFKDLM